MKSLDKRAEHHVDTSVIVNTYCRPLQLQEALTSLETQTMKNFEVIVINDGGEEVSEILAPWQDRLKISYLHHNNPAGLIACLKELIPNCKGKMITWLDDRDVFYHDHLSSMLAAHNESERDLVFSNAVRTQLQYEKGTFREDDRFPSKELNFKADDWQMVPPISRSCCAVSTKHLTTVLAEYDDFPIANDLSELSFEERNTLEWWNLIWKLSQNSGIVCTDKITCEIRAHDHPPTRHFVDAAERFFDNHPLQDNQKEPAQARQNWLHAYQQKVENASSEIECSIVIPVYNQCHYTRRCIETIRQHTDDVRYEVIVVDDGSTDDTPELLAALEPPFRSIRNAKNSGFITSVNRGAAEAKGKYLLIFNNDTEVHPRWLREMIDLHQADPSIGIIGAKLLYPDGTIQHFGVDINHDLAPYHLHRGKPGDDPLCAVVQESMGVTGACLLIDKELFDKVGGLESRYQMYFEDIDLCLKVRQLGYRVLVNPRAVVTHHETKSIDKKKAEQISENSFPVYLRKWTKALLGDRLSLGIDIRTLQFGASNMRGIGHYVFHSLTLLIESSPDIHFNLYGDREGDTTSEIRRLAAQYHPNCTFRNYHQFHTDCIDAFWLTDPLTPIPQAVAENRYVYKPMIPAELGNVPLIANAYDLIPMVFENLYLKDDQKWADEYKQRLAWLSGNVDHFLALSECTKKDYVRYLELPPDKITVVGGGVADYFQKAADQKMMATVRSRMRFQGPLILYVGSLDPRKNPEGLIETVRKIREQYQGDFRLVIVGAAADEEVDKIRQLAQQHGIQDKVIMTGYIQPDELRVIQHLSTLFLFPSLYEGFGLPVLEAMAAGLPVVSSNQSSMVEVAGAAAILCDPKDTDTMAREAVKLLTDESYRRKYIDLGVERARNYTWDRVAQKMRQTILSIIGKQSETDSQSIPEKLLSNQIPVKFSEKQTGMEINDSPPEPKITNPSTKDDSFAEQYRSLQTKISSDPLQLTYESPMLDISGYASMARSLILGLDDLGVDVRAKSMWFSGMYEAYPVKLGTEVSPESIRLKLDTGEMVEYRTQVDPVTVQRILKLTEKPAKTGPESIFVLHHIPAGFGHDTCLDAKNGNPNQGRYICSTMLETYSIPEDWRSALNRMDEVWVPSHFNLETFAKAGVTQDRIQVLPLGIDPERYNPQTVGNFPIPGIRNCNFLSIFQWTKRKGWDVLLRAYLQAFHPDDDVSLVIRSYYGRAGRVDSLIDQYIQQLGYKREQTPPIIVIGHRIPDAHMPALYNSCTAFVLPSRGEGWGIPYMESMILGKPVIATNWSGNTEFMTRENSLLIDYEDLKEVDADQIRDCPIYAGQMLAEPSVDGCAQHMRFVYEHPQEAAKIGQRARKDILENWTVKHQSLRVANRLCEIRDQLRLSKMYPVSRSFDSKKAPSIKKSSMKILFQNRHNAQTHPGGDTEVMQRLMTELQSLNVIVDFSPELKDVHEYDIVHLINLTILPASLLFAENVLKQGKSYVITSLYEDWPRYLNLSYDIIHAFKKYIESGQDERIFQQEMDQLKQLPQHVSLDNEYVANNALCHFCCSETEKNALMARFPNIKRVEIVPFAPTLNPTLGDGGKAFRKEFGLDEFILCVGRLESRKNQLMLMKALENDDIPIVFATGGFTYQQLYEDLCRRYQRKGQNLFLQRLPQELLASAFQAARLHVLPSWYELPGLVSLEAAALGTGVSGSSWGALPDYLGDAAHYFSPDDPKNMRKVILEAWENPKGNEARDAVKQYSWQESARKTLDAYQQCLEMDQQSKKITPMSWREKAKLAALKGDVQSAILEFEAQWDFDKNDPVFLYQLGELYAKIGNVEKAKEIMDRLKLVEAEALNRNTTIVPSQTISMNQSHHKERPAMKEKPAIGMPTLSQPLRVSLFTLKSNEACFYVRLIAPLEELERQGKIVLDYPVRFDGNSILNPIIPDHTDIAIFQRSFINMDPFQASIDRARALGKVIIYEIDDLLTDVPPWHPQKDMFKWGIPYFKRHLGMADQVTVSTERLKSNLMAYNPFITVIHNTVDPRLWFDPHRQYDHPGPVVIGYTGTATHMGDLRTIIPAIEQISKRYGDRVQFKFWGTCPNELISRPNVSFEREYAADYPQYANDLANADFDIMLVPLAECEFNLCKSHIKWLEYSITGLAGIYQDMTPYRGAVRHGENGLLASDVSSWVDAMSALIDNPRLRQKIASNAGREVLDHHSVLQGAAAWEKCLKDCLREKSSTVTVAEKSDAKPANPICSIIIPANNLWHLTRDCLNALFDTVDCPSEVIVVDNGSTDETPNELQAMISRTHANRNMILRTIRQEENQGFAKACNCGAKSALGKYLVFLNNDTIPQKGWQKPLIEEVENHPDVGIVGSKLLYPDDTVQHAGIVFSKDKVPFLIYRGFPKGHQAVNKTRDFPAVSAACMLVPRDLFQKLDGFDEHYRNSFEDADFCMQVASQATSDEIDIHTRNRIRYRPDSVVTHLEESTPGRRDHDEDNLKHFLEKWGDRIQPSDREFLQEDGLAIDWISDSQGKYITLKEKVERLINLAKDMEKQGSFTSALETLDEIAQIDPSRDDVYSWMSRIYMALDQLENAESCLQTAPKTTKTTLALAETRIKRHKIEEAAQELLELKKHIEQLAPEEGSLACHLLGNCMVHQNRLEEAEALFYQALKLDESSERPYLSLGSISLLRKQYDNAEKHFQQALKLNPSQPKAHFGLGMAQWNRGDKERGMREYMAALDHDISHTQALYSLTNAASDLGRWEVAAEYLERYIAKNPSHLDFLFSLSGVYYRMGKTQDAQEICSRILRQKPDHQEAKELSKKIRRENVH